MIATGEIIELQPPIGGLNRAAGYQQKPPFYSEDMLNVRAFDIIEGRARIGSRPGLVRAFAQQLVGTNVVVNGTFASDTIWTKGSGLWTIAAGVATRAAGAASNLSQVDILEIGKTFRITYTISNISGTTPSMTVKCGSTGTGTARSANGTYAEDIVCSGSTDLIFTPNATFVGNIDTVTAYQINGPVRMVSPVRTLDQSGNTVFGDEFDAAMGTNWSAPTWTLQTVLSTGLPVASGGIASSGSNVLRAALLANKSPSPTAFRELGVTLIYVPSMEKRLFLCMDMDDSAPNPSVGGVMLYVQAITAGTGASTLTFNLYVNGDTTADATTEVAGVAGSETQIRMTIDPSGVVTVYLAARTAPALQYANPNYARAGTRVGFALKGEGTGVYTDIGRFVYTYSPNAVSPLEGIAASANGAIYRESPVGTLAADVTVNYVGGLTADRRIYSAAYLQNLYIADYAVRVEATGATTGADPSLVLSSASLVAGLGISPGADVLEIISGTNVTPGVYTIASVDTSAHTLTVAAPGPGFSGSAIHYRIVRWVKILDTSVNPPTLSRVGMGTIGVSQFTPGCRSVTLWQDRLWWCNNALAPHGWWASRAGYPQIYDYGDTGTVNANGGTGGTLIAPGGVTAAVSGTQSEFAGLIGEPLVTIIPINDDLAVFACKTSLYYFTGNPRLNGAMLNISREIGIVDIDAWCRTADGRLIILTPDGLYEVSTQGAKPLSRLILPRELDGLTDQFYEISLAYDVARYGVLISATAKDAASGGVAGGVAAIAPSINYFYDIQTGAYLPQSHETTFEPTAVASYQPGGYEMPTVLLGCRDGYVRRYNDAADVDDDTGFASYVLYGPIRLGGSDYGDGFLHELVCVLDVLSSGVILTIHVGHTAQAARYATARYTTTMTTGRNRNRYPRLRGGTVYVKVTGTSGAWAIESLTITREKVGRLSVV